MDDPRKSEPARITRDQRADVAYRLMCVGIVVAIAATSLSAQHVVLFLVALASWLLCLVSGVALLICERRKGRVPRRIVAALVVAIVLFAFFVLASLYTVYTGPTVARLVFFVVLAAVVAAYVASTAKT